MDTQVKMLVARKVWTIDNGLVEASIGDVVLVSEDNAKILIDAGHAEKVSKKGAK